MRLGELFTILWVYDKSKKLDEMHEALTAPTREAAEAARQAERIERRIAAEQAQLQREYDNKYKREEGARKYKRHCDGKPFRVYTNNPLGTTAMWLVGRKFFAETYDDGKTKGYAVYEGKYLDMRIYSVAEFAARFNRWVEFGDVPAAPTKLAPSPSDLSCLTPPKSPPSRKATPAPPILRPTPIAVPPRCCRVCGVVADEKDRFCSQCGQPLG